MLAVGIVGCLIINTFRILVQSGGCRSRNKPNRSEMLQSIAPWRRAPPSARPILCSQRWAMGVGRRVGVTVAFENYFLYVLAVFKHSKCQCVVDAV